MRERIWLETHVRVMRRFLGFLRPPAQLRRVAKAKHCSGKLGQRAIDLIFGALHLSKLIKYSGMPLNFSNIS